LTVGLIIYKNNTVFNNKQKNRQSCLDIFLLKKQHVFSRLEEFSHGCI
jgi:hypothetical protein